MRLSRAFGSGLLLCALLGLAISGAEAARARKMAARPGRPSGGSTTPDAGDAYYGGPRLGTITEHVNADGQHVFSIAPSHTDVSPKLSKLAAAKSREGSEAEEGEEPLNPQLPPSRRIRSIVPDPVVQPAIAPGESLASEPFPPAAPVTGFSFEGLGSNGLTPSDSNGSVGNDQYVETVNTRFQVWSLDRGTMTATSVLGPAFTNVLWSGFGGACQTQNSGDPIVLYDKTANRWLVSQFTTVLSGGFYFQCVAISTTPDATGTYYRYAFAVPGGVFGDYPHFGAWSDAYYMMAHAFTSTSGGYVAALFAAMDRPKMLAGDPAATWQVISDPAEGGHMPADLDGAALPPTNAPGVFLSLHDDGMYVYRMKVDFATPANTVRTLEAKVPVAPSTGACNGGGSCIPQPGTTVKVGSLADRLMFRAAYRNFIDHESLVISHSVDPSVAGVVSGVRWYDFRLSGAPDATCPAYPCIYQQGTIADVANGRSRWMPSVAMDAAENILVGYSTTGMTAGTENHTIRYTGRIKSDLPGAMTVPEATIATGIANNSGSRWGDYNSMSIDPNDDCTFWYVNQYFVVQNVWTTRIASAAWPVGGGPGQCPAAKCTNRPVEAPAIGTASVPGDNQITVTWTGLASPPGAYDVERAEGTCGSEGTYQPVGGTTGAITTFTDTTVQGGHLYAYRVRTASDVLGRCQSMLTSGCVNATATGTCRVKPVFSGAAATATAAANTCGITVSWTPAATSCPLTPDIRYNVFRGTVPDFVPSVANRIATCVTGPSTYLDTDNLTSGATYYYVVRAEDGSTGSGGDCGGGNEDANSAVVSGTAYGPHRQATAGTLLDWGGDGTSLLRLNVAEAGDTADQPWRVVKTATDPGVNHTPGGAYAYRNAGPTAASHYEDDSCTEMQTPPLIAATATLNLKYWERHQIEYHWDGLAVEYSVNGGDWTDVPPPSNSAAAGCSAGDDVTGWESLACTQAPPINACGYDASKLAFNGPLGGGTTCNDFATGAATAYAHRCHQISGLTPHDAIRFRWRFTSDPGSVFAGFYLDDLAITNLHVPNACVPDHCAGQADGTPCDDGIACTTGSVCGGGHCQTPAPPPAEIAGVQVNGHVGTTISWVPIFGGTSYDVVSSTLSDLRVNGTATGTCLANNLGAASTVDGRGAPASGDGYYYVVRGQTATCSGTYGYSSIDLERTPAAGCP